MVWGKKSHNCRPKIGSLRRAGSFRDKDRDYRLFFRKTSDGITVDQVIFDQEGHAVDWILLDANPAFKQNLITLHPHFQYQRGSKLFANIGGVEEILPVYERAIKTSQPVTHILRLPQYHKVFKILITPIGGRRVTTSIVDITEQVFEMEAERSHRRLAESLRDIAAALTSTRDLEGVLDLILEHVHRITDYDAVSIMLIEGKCVRVARHHGYVELGLDDYINRFDMNVDDVHGLRWISDTHKPLVIPNTWKDGSWMIFPQTAWIRSYAGIPIMVRNELIGFLNLNSAVPDFFQPEDIKRLQPFADQAALAIENARAFEGAQKRAQRLALINRVSGILNQPLELKTVLQVTVDCLAQALNVPQVALALFDETRQHLLISADHPASGTPSIVGMELPLENNASMDFILHEKVSLLVQDAQQDDQLLAVRSAMVQRGVHSLLLIPLLIHGEVIGTVGCDLLEAGRHFNAEEVEMAETIANLASVRIEQARLYTEERMRASELALLHVTSLDITMTNDLPTLLKTIVERAAWLMGAQGGTLYLCNLEKQVLERQVSFNLPFDEPEPTMAYGQGACGWVAVSGQPLIIPDYQQWPQRWIQDSMIRQPFALLSVPVIWQGRVTGILQLTRVDSHKPFTQKEVDLLALFSNQVAVSLENARLYNKLQQMAIQDTLTGLYNRRGMTDIAMREIDRSRRFQHPLSALMVDIDHFKGVNDTYGHPVGDQVLVWLANFLRSFLRSIDVIGRYGGEEFFILLLENDQQAAMGVAERICTLVAESAVPTRAGEVRITLSIGVAELSQEMPGLDDLVNAADDALYLAKRAGRNQAKVSLLVD
jgi:diguanylate cyclase (GGDEF)-like protein